MTVYVIVIVT